MWKESAAAGSDPESRPFNRVLVSSEDVRTIAEASKLTTYATTRILRSLVLLFGLSLFFYGIAHLAPGGICSIYPDKTPTACASTLGLSSSPPMQYANWISGYLHGDFGLVASGTSVTSLILGALPATVLLVLGSYLWIMLLTVILTLLSTSSVAPAVWRAGRTAGILGVSLPAFWLALMFIYVFAIHFQVVPSSDIRSTNIPSFWSNAWFSLLSSSPRMVLGNLAKHLLLPSAVLAAVIMVVDRSATPIFGKLACHSGLRTAKGKGAGRRGMVFHGSLRDALALSIANIPNFLAGLITGLLVVNIVFSYDGLGYLFYSRLASGDYAVVMACLMLGSVLLLLIDLAADIIGAALTGVRRTELPSTLNGVPSASPAQ